MNSRPPATVLSPADLQALAEHAGDVKSGLVTFAQAGRFARVRDAFLVEALESRGVDPAEAGMGDLIPAYDDFIMTFRFPDGSGLMDIFLKTRRDLPTADRELIKGWRDPVDGIFEVVGKDDRFARMTLFNLLDDLEYDVFVSAGPQATRTLRKGMFAIARLVPLGAAAPDAWTVSGIVSSHPKAAARQVAQTAIQIAAATPEAVFRNPAKVEQGWEIQRQDHERFIEFFGSDEVIFGPKETEDKINAFYRHVAETLSSDIVDKRDKRRRKETADALSFQLPEEWADAGTIGIIYDATDGMGFLSEYGMMRELFANPQLAADKEYLSALKDYLNEDSINPSALIRLAAAYPATVNAVYRKFLKKPSFTWVEHGDKLLRKHKPWYYEREPLPSVSVIGDRLKELATR